MLSFFPYEMPWMRFRTQLRQFLRVFLPTPLRGPNKLLNVSNVEF